VGAQQVLGLVAQNERLERPRQQHEEQRRVGIPEVGHDGTL
jgi:hypothetical protein